MSPEFSLLQLLLVAVIFVWTGFVRTGLGFGGAALSLPLLLFIVEHPLFWLPIIGTHLLFFSALTLRTRIHDVDWIYLRRVAPLILPAALVGILGLLQLPAYWLNLFIYSLTLFYGVVWMFNLGIKAGSPWGDRLLLITGGYVAGISLSGAPLMVSVFMRNIRKEQLRNTMFVLWFVLVSMKMSAFVALGVELHFWTACLLLPVAAIGNYLGIKAHDLILREDARFKRFIGGGLVLVCLLGLASLYQL